MKKKNEEEEEEEKKKEKNQRQKEEFISGQLGYRDKECVWSRRRVYVSIIIEAWMLMLTVQYK